MRRAQLFQPIGSSRITAFIFSLSLLIIFVSCKKQNSTAEQPQRQSYDALIPKIKSWLDSQKTDLPTNAVAKIDLLRENLDYNNLYLEKYRTSEDFIIVPVSDRFQSENNKDKNPINYLVLVLKNEDSITKGNIIQYISSSGNKKVPQNTFSNIFTYKKLDCSGKFTVLGVTDDFKYELAFENGKLGSVEERINRNSKRNGGRLNGCIDWYLITTYYYYDGTSSTTEEYLFTTCDDCEETKVNGRSYRINCGGGGGNYIEYQYVLSRPWKWDVATTANWWAESYETVSGVRETNGGGYFTAISHNSSYFATNLPGYTWQEVGYVVSIDNPQKVYATATGRVTQGVVVNTYSGFQFKSFAELMGFSSQ